MEIISIEYNCTHCNKSFSLPLKQAPVAFNTGDCICDTCMTKYHFDVETEPLKDECIAYTYTNGTETKTSNGFIRSVCPTKSAILNNI